MCYLGKGEKMKMCLLRNVIFMVVLSMELSGLAMNPKELLSTFDELQASKSTDEYMRFIRLIMKLTDSEKQKCVDFIISKRRDRLPLLGMLMEPNDLFDVALKLLGNESKLSPTQKSTILSLLCSIYYRPEITNKQRKKFEECLATCMERPNMLAPCVTTIEMLRMKDMIPPLLIALNSKGNKFREKLRILSSLKTLEYDKMERLKKDFRKKLLASGDKDKMFEYSVELNDKIMKLNIDILKLASRSPNERMDAVLRLRKSTGKNFGFNPMGSVAEREKSIEKWKKLLR